MISIKGLVKEFKVSGGVAKAINRLDLDIEAGEFFAIVGASGSGKTTLLRCIAGLEQAEQGRIDIAGRTVFSDKPRAWVPPQQRDLGMVFQSYAVWPHLTVYENVELPLQSGVNRAPRSELKKCVTEALEIVELHELAGRSSSLLSGGQQQRVALARAIAVSSKLLLMDEPLSNLDARLREDVRGRIRDIATKLGSTVVYVTHDQVEALAIADRIALIDRGRLLQVGTPKEVYFGPTSRMAAEFFGSVNWLQSKIISPGIAETALGRFAFDYSIRQGVEATLGIRPEFLTPEDEFMTPNNENNIIEGRVTKSSFLGDQFQFELSVANQILIGKSRFNPDRGDVTGRFLVDRRSILVFPESS